MVHEAESCRILLQSLCVLRTSKFPVSSTEVKAISLVVSTNFIDPKPFFRFKMRNILSSFVGFASYNLVIPFGSQTMWLLVFLTTADL